jgi:hypothetical protein
MKKDVSYILDTFHVVDVSTLIVLPSSAWFKARKQSSTGCIFVFHIIVIVQEGGAASPCCPRSASSSAFLTIPSVHRQFSSPSCTWIHCIELILVVQIGIRVLIEKLIGRVIPETI